MRFLPYQRSGVVEFMKRRVFSRAKNRRVALFDVDSTIPNLALMKLSTFYKQRGDKVEAYNPIEKIMYDLIYASKVFSTSDSSMLDKNSMIIGGTGWDFSIELAEEIESLQPDYSLYSYPHNIGFTMRGCRLRCSFCVVPEKEGKPYGTNTIEELWTQRNSDFLVLLDNDFFGNPEWRGRIEELRYYNLRVNFSQGINIRNLKLDQAQALASVRFVNLKGTAKKVYFAWDDPRHEKLIHKGLQIAFEGGIKPYQMAFYVLIGYHSTPEEDLHRVETLRSYGCDPFVMPYDRSFPYQRDFARWVNHKAIFKTVSWKDYKRNTKRMSKKDPGFFDYLEHGTPKKRR